MAADLIDNVVSLCKRRGFVYPSSEIYGGQRAAWDYGPLGVELKENVKRQWWQSVVRERDDVVGVDTSVILAPEVWQASGPRLGVRRPARPSARRATSAFAPTTSKRRSRPSTSGRPSRWPRSTARTAATRASSPSPRCSTVC